MHHFTRGISSLLYSVNLILFTLLLIHLILRASPHHSPHRHSHHLSLPRSFSPDLKLICFRNSLLHSLSGSIWSSWILDLDRTNWALAFITARCTLVQSAVLRSHVVCLSVSLSVTLVNCDNIGWSILRK